jgi:hypothetical protein
MESLLEFEPCTTTSAFHSNLEDEKFMAGVKVTSDQFDCTGEGTIKFKKKNLTCEKALMNCRGKSDL